MTTTSALTPSPPTPHQIMHRNYRVYWLLLSRRADPYTVTELDDGTVLEGRSSLQLLDAATALAAPPPRSGAEAEAQVTSPDKSTCVWLAAVQQGWGGQILPALARVWGRNTTNWPDAPTIGELRAALAGGGVETYPIPRP